VVLAVAVVCAVQHSSQLLSVRTTQRICVYVVGGFKVMCSVQYIHDYDDDVLSLL
jgi:hypothetical protein